MTLFTYYLLRNYALTPLPLSHKAPELTSREIHVVEHHSQNIRGGGAALRCAPPYFDHCQVLCCSTICRQSLYVLQPVDLNVTAVLVISCVVQCNFVF